jgi:hypothetical protein
LNWMAIRRDGKFCFAVWALPGASLGRQGLMEAKQEGCKAKKLRFNYCQKDELLALPVVVVYL